MMLSRRHLADRNFRDYGCHDDRVKKGPSLVDPIDDGERLVRRPPRRRTPEKEPTPMRRTLAAAYRVNADVAKKSAGILKLPPSPADPNRMARDLHSLPCQMGSRESAQFNAGRNLRWSEEDLERTGIGGGGGRRPNAEDDFQQELSHLARLQEEIRKTVQSRKNLRLGSEPAAFTESSTMNCKSSPEVQSCPDIRSTVNESIAPVRLLRSSEAADSHRPQRPDRSIQCPSTVDFHKYQHRICTGPRGNVLLQEDEQLPRRVRGRSLEHYEHRNPNGQRNAALTSRWRSGTRNASSDREKVDSTGPGSDWDGPVSGRSHSRTGATGYEGVRAGSVSYDRSRRPSACVCRCCGAAVGKESPDSLRERLLIQERWDAGVWQELRSLLQALPVTSTTDERQQQQQQPKNQPSKSSSSNETIYGCQTRGGKSGDGRGGACRSKRSGGLLYDKMTQTEDLCRNLRNGAQRQGTRTASFDHMYNHHRCLGEVTSRPVRRGCQIATDHDGLDAHNCDSTITEVTSLWPSTSGSGTQGDGTSGGAAATTTSTTDATTACQSQESLSLLQSISAELLGSSVSSECLRAAIDATTGGQPLDENSVLEAIDREMADVNQFVRETLDVSEIKPKEYLQMHMRHLQKFTNNLDQFLSRQKPTANPDSYRETDSAAFKAMQHRR